MDLCLREITPLTIKVQEQVTSYELRVIHSENCEQIVEENQFNLDGFTVRLYTLKQSFATYFRHIQETI